MSKRARRWMVGLAIAAGLIVAVILILPRWLDDRYYIGPVSDHYDGERSFNPGAATSKGLGALLRWRLTADRADWPEAVNLVHG